MKTFAFLWVVVTCFSLTYHLPTFAETSIKLQTKERVHSKILPNRLSGFTVSPDGLRVAYVVGAGKYSEDYGNGFGDSGWEKQSAVVDGKAGKRYDGVQAPPIFSPDGQHVVYSAYWGGSEIQVLDNKETDCLPNQHIEFRNDGLPLLCVENDQQRNAQNSKQNRKYIGKGYPTFSPDNQRLAVEINSSNENPLKREAYMVIDGKDGKKYNQINTKLYSPDSSKFAYVAVINRNENVHEWRVVLNNKEDKSYPYVSDIIFSPDSLQLAYIAHSSQARVGKSFVLKNGISGKQYDAINDLAFSPDSKTLAYVVSKNKKMFVVVNGIEGKPYDYILAKGVYEDGFSELEVGSLRFNSNQKLRYLAVRNKQILLVESSFK